MTAYIPSGSQEAGEKGGRSYCLIAGQLAPTGPTICQVTEEDRLIRNSCATNCPVTVFHV